jgi:hypothetical protein
MNEVLTGFGTGVVGLVLGYFGHVLQERYTRKHQHLVDDRALMQDLHRKLVEQRESRDRPEEVTQACKLLESEAALLRHAKLRKRVIENLKHVDLYWATARRGYPRDAQNVWIQDSLDALAAAARGERLPDPSSQYEDQLFRLHRVGRKLAPGVTVIAAGIARMAESDPEFVALRRERAAWEAERRAKSGWRRFIPRRKGRSEPAAS